MERSKQYITLDEFLIYKEKGQIYEGYVIGYGYAFYEALAVQTPYCSYAPYAPPSPMLSNYQTVWQQNLDNTPEAVMESFGEDHVHLLQQLVREQNGEYYVNMGYGEILRVPVEGSIISVDMNSSGKLKLSVKSVSGSDSIEKSIEIDLESFNTVFNNPNDLPYMSTYFLGTRIGYGGVTNQDGWFNCAIPIGVAETVIFGGTEYADNMVRTAFKTGRNPVSWSKLTPKQQAWRTTRVLGKKAKYVKYAKGAGIVGTGISIGMAGYDIASGEGTTIDYFDVGVGTASIGAAFFLTSNPAGWVIGADAAIYFTGRLIYDIYEEIND